MSSGNPEISPEQSRDLITRSLREWRAGDAAALERLTREVYSELRRVAGAIMAGHSPNQTLQPTVLVHELYFQLPNVREIDWESRAHFINIAARMMRNILVDYARKRRAAKRGGDAAEIAVEPASEDPAFRLDVLRVNEALDRFAEGYPRQARVVELRFFGGLTAEETVAVLKGTGAESSLRTVERDWKFARAWLEGKLEEKQEQAE